MLNLVFSSLEMGANCLESKSKCHGKADGSNEQGQTMLSIAEYLRVMKFE
jgi:hypothetical protein